MKGRIEVICGSMFSGKTEELQRRVKRARIAGQKVWVCKPDIDNRYSENQVVTHNGACIDSINIDTQNFKIPFRWGIKDESIYDIDVIAIDEAQFFNDTIIKEVKELANKMNKRIIIAGLDMDFEGNTFGSMGELMSIANDVQKVHAVCVKCGSDATFSHRIDDCNDKVELGNTDKYEPLCRDCYNKL